MSSLSRPILVLSLLTLPLVAGYAGDRGVRALREVRLLTRATTSVKGRTSSEGARHGNTLVRTNATTSQCR